MSRHRKYNSSCNVENVFVQHVNNMFFFIWINHDIDRNTKKLMPLKIQFYKNQYKHAKFLEQSARITILTYMLEPPHKFLAIYTYLLYDAGGAILFKG